MTASGDQLLILRQIRAKVQLVEFDVFHDFVVKKLVTSVILGIDFLQQNGLILDFNQTPVAIRKTSPNYRKRSCCYVPIYQDFCQNQAHVCMVKPLVTKPEVDIVNECTITKTHLSLKFLNALTPSLNVCWKNIRKCFVPPLV